MYSVRREELPSGKAREEAWRRTVVGIARSRERKGELRNREGRGDEKRPRTGSSFRQSRQPVWRD
jgi:hypothetical protein